MALVACALLSACGLAAAGVASAATPVETTLQGVTQSVATAVDDQTGAVAPGVGQAAATTVDQVTNAPAVKTVVKAVSEPVDRM